MDFKNLAEVTQLTEVPEGASVLAATAEGEVVRVPGDGLGGGGGGLEELVVKFMFDGHGGITSADVSYADVVDAISKGKRVTGVLLLSMADEEEIYEKVMGVSMPASNNLESPDPLPCFVFYLVGTTSANVMNLFYVADNTFTTGMSIIEINVVS